MFYGSECDWLSGYSHLPVTLLAYLLSYLPFQVISCDQNLNRCCELIELTAKIQGQLFAILNLAAAEGKLYIYSAGLCYNSQCINRYIALVNQVATMPEWTLSKRACCRGSGPVSQWRGPRSLRTPVCSSSRWHHLLLGLTTQNVSLINPPKLKSSSATPCHRQKIHQNIQITFLYCRHLVSWLLHHHLLSSGFSGKGQEDQGALCLPW